VTHTFHRRGFGLIELIVALTILAVGVLGMAAAAVYAQQSFARAEASERATRLASSLLDSLVTVHTPAAGERIIDDIVLRWTVLTDSTHTEIAMQLMYYDAGSITRRSFTMSK